MNKLQQRLKYQMHHEGGVFFFFFFLIAPESLWFHEILVDSSDASVHIIVSFKYIIQEHLPRIYFYSQLYGLFYHTEEKPFLSMKNTYVCI